MSKLPSSNYPSLKHTKLEGVEPLAHGGIYSTVWCARALKVQIGDQIARDVEVIVKRYKIDLAELPEQLDDLAAYRASIDARQAQTNIYTLPNYGIEIDERLGHIYFIDQKAQQPDVAHLLKSNEVEGNEKLKLVADLFKSLTSLPYDDNSRQTEFMIDGKFSNPYPAVPRA